MERIVEELEQLGLTNYIDVEIPRKVPKGAINKNFNVRYLNMEEKLKEYFDRYNNEVPLHLYCKNWMDSTHINYEEELNSYPKLGTVLSFNDNTCTVRFDDTENYKNYTSMINPTIVLIAIVETYEEGSDTVAIHNVCGLQLVDEQT
jgi:hypothetical protein